MTDEQKSAMDERAAQDAEQRTPELRNDGEQQQSVAPQSLEDARRLIADLQARIKELNAEAKRHRLRAREFERLEQERQAAEQKKRHAEMSEAERLRAQLAEFERKHSELLEQIASEKIRAEVERAARRMGVADDELDTVYALVDLASVSLDDDGRVVGAEEAVRALLKRKPRLVASKQATDIDATARGEKRFAISDDDEKRIAMRYGIRR